MKAGLAHEAAMPASLLSPDDRAELARLGGARVAFDEPMSRHTTLRIGGPADAWFAPAAVDELRAVVEACAARRIPMIAVGGGSNLLVRDGGIRGVAIATRNLRGLERVGDAELRVEAGVSTGKLLASATGWELGGIEFLGGVPGSVGGGLIMNAGTYLGEFKDVTTEVASVRLGDGALVRRPAGECGFVYRGSALPPGEVVVEGRLALRPRPRAEIDAVVRDLRDRRRSREPQRVSNAGSVFKNPPGDFAGRLIEATGLKGTRVGGAECSPVHANWFVNQGGATAADMFELIRVARARVAEVHGVELELEWKVIGDD
ncbi:MAG TPA: UDP-N-acetylmuramate dehydrogenase [Kofleriaceae bacterium]|nr:UDP-N-acetylmuramate dehydrogenase [Kofleriaceae bacterium]